MSNYQMSNKQKLALTWRAHQKQIFHYEDGAWVMVEGLRVKAWHILLALEGLFIQVSNDTADIEWTWTKVEPYVEDICRKHAECSISQTLVDHLELVAKSNSDHLRVTTSNKVWTAKWTRRVAEMIAAYRKQWDDDCSTISPLSKLYLVEWDTAMPRSEGVCFSDVYLNATWQMATKSPDNNCYLRIGYPYFYEKTLQSYPGVSIQDFRNVLRTFLESVFRKRACSAAEAMLHESSLCSSLHFQDPFLGRQGRQRQRHGRDLGQGTLRKRSELDLGLRSLPRPRRIPEVCRAILEQGEHSNSGDGRKVAFHSRHMEALRGQRRAGSASELWLYSETDLWRQHESAGTQL